MKNSNVQLRIYQLLAGLACACSLTVAALANEGAAAQEPKPFDVKNTFRNICGFCHEDYGRHAGKGPQLMDNPNTDEFLFNRIKNGKPGRMAAWKSVFTDDQIHQMVKFIRNLKPDVEPQNP